MTRRLKIVLAGAVAAVLVLTMAASCSFPDVTFATSGDDAATDTANADARANDAATDGRPVGANEDVDPTGLDKDATAVPDSQRIDAGPDATCCDCDGDEFKGTTGTCSKPAGDCDDTNPYIFPGQDFVNTPGWDTSHTPTYDWDCDTVVTKQYAHSLPACASQLKVSGCSNFQNGYNSDPQCGVGAHYVVSCVADTTVLNLACTEMAHDNRVQGCR